MTSGQPEAGSSPATPAPYAVAHHAQQLLLVARNGGAPVEPCLAEAAAHQVPRKGVEGGDGDVLPARPHPLLEPPLELGARLAAERQHQHLLGRHALQGRQ